MIFIYYTQCRRPKMIYGTHARQEHEQEFVVGH